jgi:hypothetical protein
MVIAAAAKDATASSISSVAGASFLVFSAIFPHLFAVVVG